MLRIIQNSSPGGAQSYYSTADYYAEGQELVGVWRGLGAVRLGLSGVVQKEAWDALCENRDPSTRLPLTVRNKQNRSVGYDFNFHVPKSVSLLYGLTQDERLLRAFRDCVRETMADIEAEMKTRVRKSGKQEDRITGEMVFGEFVHTTSRPIGGVPDPHLHAHCFVQNLTFDPVENRWKAAQFRDLKRDAPYFEAVFHSQLARRMAELGLPIERTKAAWEIAGFSKSTLDKFSRRTAAIEAKARAEGITDPAEKSALGARTREKKAKNLTTPQLQSEWRSRFNSDEQTGFDQIVRGIGGRAIPEQAQAAHDAAAYAIDHSFERQSVVPERTMLREALRRSFGQAGRTAVERSVGEQDLIRADREGRRWVTTRAVLDEESWMVDYARRGRGTCRPLGSPTHRLRRTWLTAEQKKAIAHVLGSNDRIILLRGSAGTGKTTLMSEAVEGIEASGTKVFTFAPSAGASRGVLRDEGFANADTVSRLLIDTTLQENVRGQALWIDEASLLGVRTMTRVFELAQELDCRLILSGDIRQHGSVEAGAALRLLETEAGLVPARIAQIQRQRGAYRRAVAELCEGRVEEGFRRLDAMGVIKEVADANRYHALAEEYVSSVGERLKTLVVSPTHGEAERVTDEIRAALRNAGQLGREERKFSTLQSANLTVAERSDAVNLSSGDTLVYHQNAPGRRKGERVVVGTDTIAVDQASRYTVFHPAVLSLSAGDAVRVTQNGKSREGRRLNNGDLFTVKEFTVDGDIRLTNGMTVDKAFGHLAHGYVVTSHASQGKSIDKVIIAESSDSHGAASCEQFYVSVSRGKKDVSIYTDDRKALLEAVTRHDDRLSATEFVVERQQREQILVQQRAALLNGVPPMQTSIEQKGFVYER